MKRMHYIDRQDQMVDKYAKYNNSSPNSRNGANKRNNYVTNSHSRLSKQVLKEKMEVYTG